jgi:hypothetical protein
VIRHITVATGASRGGYRQMFCHIGLPKVQLNFIKALAQSISRTAGGVEPIFSLHDPCRRDEMVGTAISVIRTSKTS